MRINCDNARPSSFPYCIVSGRRPRNSGWLAYYGELMRSWTRRGGASHDAQDATQDTVLSILQADATLIRDPRAYLDRSVRNGLARQYQRQARDSHVALHELPEEHQPSGSIDPHNAMRASQLADALLLALEELPLPCRQVFAWHRLEGRSMPDIADQMGLSLSMVEKHMTRAIRHIQARLRQFGS
ncbi:sigma-70 family RNA polymerase sigma factor [Achromobacter pestifer]|uniref:Sigma-70 family RNA polymerase sigma factor n=2 Tax=Achromobacter pestifer TaxID=1353889 RepID=A0A7D4E0N1_9BURK|nr:sigma-70 family RNA polymerase sigma factor [Achromobacter pestifer]